MDSFEKFDPLTGEVISYPFIELLSVVSQARSLVEGLSVNNILSIERDLDILLDDQKILMAECCLDDYVNEVIETGSWERHYLPVNTALTQESVRKLLENWPATLEPPFYLKEEDFTDVEAIRAAIWMGEVGSLDDGQPSPVQYVAVLALMKAAQCFDTLQCPEEDLGTCEDGPISARLINAANYAIEAVQTIGFAGELVAVAESESDAAEHLAESIEERQRRFSKERALKAATARHEHLKPAIRFVRDEWQKHSEAYNFNKTDFARTYVELVRNGYRNKRGDPLQVTIKTITDVWLAPPASKPTGLLAGG